MITRIIGGLNFAIMSPSVYDSLDYQFCLIYASDKIVRPDKVGWYVCKEDGSRLHRDPYGSRDEAISVLKRLIHEGAA